MAGDPNWDNVALLLHCDGVNDGTIFTDSAGHTMTRNGNAVTKTSAKKYGSASAYFDGSGDYLSTPSAAEFSAGTSDFTVEGWLNVTNHTAGRVWFDTRSVWNDAGFTVYVDTDGAIKFFSAGAIRAASTATITDGAWTHVAVVRQSGTIKVYVGGSGGTGGAYSSSVTCPGSVRIGVDSAGAAGWLGYLDDIRFTPGVARYASNFTPPDAAFPDYSRYVAGTITELLSHTNWTVRSTRLDTGALLGEVVATDGTYEVPCGEYSGLVLVSCHPRMGAAWAANTAYSSGDYCVPTDPVSTPFVYKSTASGTSHTTTEPTWPVTEAATVSDGTVTWVCIARMARPMLQGPLAPAI
jgi:hypothetical protein